MVFPLGGRSSRRAERKMTETTVSPRCAVRHPACKCRVLHAELKVKVGRKGSCSRANLIDAHFFALTRARVLFPQELQTQRMHKPVVCSPVIDNYGNSGLATRYLRYRSI